MTAKDPKAYRRKWYAENKEKIQGYARRSRLKTKYGLSIADHDQMRQAQEGGCAICGDAPGGRWNRFAVDHNHYTGAVRGLLCDRCNRGLGFFNEDPVRLLWAYEYLTRLKVAQ